MSQEAPVRALNTDKEVSSTLPEPVANLARELDVLFHEWRDKFEGGEPEWGYRFAHAEAEIMSLSQSFPEMQNKVGYLEWHHDTKEGTKGMGSALINGKTKRVVEIENWRCYFVNKTSAQLRFLIDDPEAHKIYYLV